MKILLGSVVLALLSVGLILTLANEVYVTWNTEEKVIQVGSNWLVVKQPVRIEQCSR
jgi:hypothetical protein